MAISCVGYRIRTAVHFSSIILNDCIRGKMPRLRYWSYRERDYPPTVIGRIGRGITLLRLSDVSGEGLPSYGYWSYRERGHPPTVIGRIGREISLPQLYHQVGKWAHAVMCGGRMRGRFDVKTSSLSRSASVSKLTSSAVAIS